VRILADQAETEAEVDVEAARKRLEAAQNTLKGMSPDDARFHVEAATVKRETARISGFARR